MIDRSGVRVFTREWPGSNFVAVKAVQIIDSSLSNIIGNYADVASFPEWVKDMQEAYVIDAFDETRARKVYMRVGLPWPLNDRDRVTGQQFIQDPTTKMVRVRDWYEGDTIPEVEGVIRMPRLNSEFVLIPEGENKTKMIFQGHNDPGGFIPSFLVNWMIEDVFFASMVNMQARFESPEFNKSADWVIDFTSPGSGVL